MPLTYQFVDEGRGTLWTGWGRLTGAELLEAVKEATGRWRVEPPFLYALCDYSGVSEADISAREVRQLAAISVAANQCRPQGGISAIFAPSDVPYGLARMWQAFTERPDWDTAVFRDRARAVAWLKERVAARFGLETSLV